MGGTDTVLLTRQDHAKHDVLQTECYGEGTLTPFYYKELIGTDWEQRAKDALFVRQSQSGKIGGKVTGPVRGLKNVETGHWKEVQRLGGKVSGKINGAIQGSKNRDSGHITRIATKDSCKKGGSNTASQKWVCLVTGEIRNPGNLTKYQHAKGIDTSLRKRIV